MRSLLFFCLVVLVFGCIKDRSFPVPVIVAPPPPLGSYGLNSLIINEFIAAACKSSEVSSGACKGIVQGYYMPTESRNGKWVELYNPGDTAIRFSSGNWFLTDDTTNKDKYQIPSGQKPIPSKGFLLICNDGTDNPVSSDTSLHASFSTARYGGDIALYYRKISAGPDTSFILVNSVSYVKGAVQVPEYDSTARHISYGRTPDGNGGSFVRFTKASPGKSNQ